MTGRTGCFPEGHVPANKGRPNPGASHPNSRRTQFKKGIVPANTKPLGYERVGKDGYIEIKVAEPNPWTGAPTRFRMKHVYLWERANGPVPKGHALKCLDGNRLNTEPANWIAIPKSLLPRLAGRWTIPYDAAPDELKPTILTIARLQYGVRSAREKARG